jgi:hypothetical protein
MIWVWGVEPAEIRDQYYCPPCFNLLMQRLFEDHPELDNSVSEEAAVTEMALLLGVKSRLKRPQFTATTAADYEIPVDIIVDRSPFKRYFTPDDEMEALRAEHRKRLAIEERDAGDYV